MKKKFMSLVAILALLAVGYFLVTQESDSRKGKYEQTAEPLSMILRVTGDGTRAEIRYFTAEISSKSGTASLPWEGVVLSTTAKVSASTVDGDEVVCWILNNSTGQVLDRDVGKNVRCDYSTF